MKSKQPFLFLALIVAVCGPLRAYDHIELQKNLQAPAADKAFYPTQIAVDATGRAWVVDTPNNRLHLFSAQGDWVASFGKPGAGNGEFTDPHGVAVDALGNAFVADSGNDRIEVLSPEGKFLYAFGQRGSDPGQFHNPWALAVSPDGTVIVAERGGERLELFSRDGVYLKTIEVGSGIDGIAADVAGRIYTANAKLHQIEQWTTGGQLLKSFSGQEPGMKTFDDPRNVAANAYGLIYVADRGASAFRELDASGHTLGLFGRSGKGPGQFNGLEGIAVFNERLFVCDGKNHRVVTFGLSRQAELAPLSPISASRVQVTQQELWKASADALAFSADGHLLALASDRGVLTTFAADGKTAAELDLKKPLGVRSPSAFLTDASGNLWIADTGNDRVVKADPQGALLTEFGKSTSFFKSGPGELSKPQSLTLSKQGNLLVADTGNNRFQTFNDQGLYLYAGGQKGSDPGQFKNPVSIGWDTDRIFVADSSLHKIVAFNSSGRYLYEIGLLGPEPLGLPRQIALDRDGNIFVLDTDKSRVLVYDSQGVFLGGFAGAGHAKGFLDHPRTFALSDDGHLFIAEEGRIQGFHVVLLPPAPAALHAKTGEGFVELKWDAVKTRFPAKYTVYRSTPLGAPQRVKETVETTVTDDTLQADTPYTYTVTAQSFQGAMSVPSAPVLVNVKAANNGPRLDIVAAHLNDVFSAYYKYYLHVPLGSVVIRNNGQSPFQKVKVSFAIQGYMDYPSETVIGELHSNEEKTIPLLALFNNRILEVSETTPIQAQVKLSFYQGDQENSVVSNLPFKLYSRNSISWNNKESFAAFVTPNDPPVIDFARGTVLPFIGAHKAAPVPEAVVKAWTLFEGLGTYGISYLPRPNNPYDRVSLDTSTVDSLQFARETLGRKSGDCADVVALLASGLESLGLATAALDAPGHLFLMVDTGETDKANLSYPENHLVFYGGSYWIPLEATMLGSSFTEAWRKGAEEYAQWTRAGKLTAIDIHHAWATFEPATLPESPSEYKPPTKEAIEEKFLRDWRALAELRWLTAQENFKKSKSSDGAAQAALDFGLLAAQFKHYEEARLSFQGAIKDPAVAGAAYNNLGNLDYLEGHLETAESHYKDAAKADPSDGRVWLNLARLYLKKNMAEPAATAFNQALSIEPGLKDEFGDVSALAP